MTVKRKKKGLPKALTMTREALREQLPSAVAPKKRGGGGGNPLQLVLPSVVVRALKVRAAEQDTTVRSLVLQALAAQGIEVPPEELGDRRK